MREDGRVEIQKRFPKVSCETFKRLDAYVALVLKWQKSINLVSPTTLPFIWERHIADSLQIATLVDSPAQWVDIGSGGGFPGLVVAAFMADHSPCPVHLVESDVRKSVFMREAARQMNVDVTVHAERAEKFFTHFNKTVDVVSARALAPLAKLLDLAHPALTQGAIGIFPKGKDAQQELTEAQKHWNMDTCLVPSVTDPDACIFVLKDVRRKEQQVK